MYHPFILHIKLKNPFSLFALEHKYLHSNFNSNHLISPYFCLFPLNIHFQLCSAGQKLNASAQSHFSSPFGLTYSETFLVFNKLISFSNCVHAIIIELFPIYIISNYFFVHKEEIKEITSG